MNEASDGKSLNPDRNEESNQPEPPKGNPEFNLARGAAIMTGAPPFDFQDVILRVFPLRADIHALRLFCDRFLNIAPDFELFEPAAPYVILQTINYGRMSAEASNFGWVSQNEVAFTVLLNWYRVENGRPVFHDSASVCPFIFVDEESSVRTGREVFGWPKSLAWLTPGIDAWARDPRSPRTLFKLSAMVFPELFAGERQEARVLLEIEQEASPSAAEFPVNPFNRLNPLVSLPRMVLSSMKLAGDMLENLMRVPLRGFPLPGFQSSGGQRGVAGASFRTAPPWETLRDAFGNLNPFAQLPAFNTINLKQFRDSAKPEEVCYQALVNAKMTAKAIKRGGLLGQQAMALGDPSGGYSLKLHRHPAWPIVESLGLEVACESSEEGCRVATLKPILPNWIETDFHYGTGEVLCWRSCHTDWAKPPPTRKESGKDGSPSPPSIEAPKGKSGAKPHRYNTAQGGSLNQVRGPFHFNNVTMRVLPLLADEAKLQQFCDKYLNHHESKLVRHECTREAPSGLEAVDPEAGLPNNLFRAWGSYVYLIVTNFEETTSDLNIGWWAERQVAFAFPVKWYRFRRGSRRRGIYPHWHLVSTALVSPYIYADSSVAATTGREMQGRPVVKAEIASPPSEWVQDRGPVRPSELLCLRADVYPALNVNQKMETRTLLEVTGRDVLPSWDEEGWKALAWGPSAWGETLVRELKRKQDPEITKASEAEDAETRRIREGRGASRRGASAVDTGLLKNGLPWLKGLALEVLSGRRPINHISLKQFRDAEDPQRACYQAITLAPETLERIRDLREIDDRLHVAIHRYPSQPIVETLGLQVKSTDGTSQKSVIDYLQPIRPFWLRANVKAHLGTDVFWRAGSSEWQAADKRWRREPRGPGTQYGKRRRMPEHPLFFERTDPVPFGRQGVEWAESNGQNRLNLRDLRSERMTRFLEEWKLLRPDREAPMAGVAADQEPEASDVAGSRAALGLKSIRFALGWLEKTGIAPQLALESILSKEWLNFGRSRWRRREEATAGEFTRRIRELVTKPEDQFAVHLRDQLQYPWHYLQEELERGDQGVPPLKKDFIIRQDTIGHPATRREFERLWDLERLDDEYWYVWPEGERQKRLDLRQWLRGVVWEDLKDTWGRELEELEEQLEDLTQDLDSLAKEIEGEPSLSQTETRLMKELKRRVEEGITELRASSRSVIELRSTLERRMKSAGDLREFEREYRHVQGLIRSSREKREEAAKLLITLSNNPEELVSKELLKKVYEGYTDMLFSDREPVAAGAQVYPPTEEPAAPPADGAEDPPPGPDTEQQVRADPDAGGEAPIPLGPGIPRGLGKARLEKLATYGVHSMQDLLKVEAETLRDWISVSAQSAAKILSEAQEIVDQARARKKR